MKSALWKAVVVVVGGVALFAAWVRYRGPQTGLITVPTLRGPAAIAVLPDGVQKISVASGGYGMVLPHDWRVEPTGGPDLAAYPPASYCKIEVSVFENQGGTPLGDWIARHLAEDPTLRIMPLSFAPRAFNGISGFQWIGDIDDRRTVLIYLDGRKRVYEIAPSTLDAAATSSDSCFGVVEAVAQQFMVDR